MTEPDIERSDCCAHVGPLRARVERAEATVLRVQMLWARWNMGMGERGHAEQLLKALDGDA